MVKWARLRLPSSVAEKRAALRADSQAARMAKMLSDKRNLVA